MTRTARIFVMHSREVFMATLDGFDWDFTLGSEVILRGAADEMRALQVGTGNVDGQATVMLRPVGEWIEARERVEAMLADGRVEITRKRDAR